MIKSRNLDREVFFVSCGRVSLPDYLVVFRIAPGGFPISTPRLFCVAVFCVETGL